MRWFLSCFCLLAESYETKKHYHYQLDSILSDKHWNRTEEFQVRLSLVGAWVTADWLISGLPHWRIYLQIPQIWQVWKEFGCNCFGLAKWKTSIIARISYIFTYRYSIFKLTDGLKIIYIKWRWRFLKRSMLLNTSYQISLQNLEVDYLEIFAKCWKPKRFLFKYKAKDKEL